MIVDRNTTVQEILEQRPDAVKIFEKHGVDVPLECAENIQSCGLILCDSMCHIDNLDALIADLQKFMDQPAS
ncbi:MAG TPA: hypothetical protein V6D22_24735 [Candidatus Obscuribacterales bacterium]